MRYSLACPACGAGTRFVVVHGELQAACRRCAVRATVERACCGDAPGAEELTDALDEEACPVCGEERALRTGPIRAPTALAGGDARAVPEPGWGRLALDERSGASPYRDGRRTGLRLRRPRVGAAEVALVAAGFGWPAVPVAAMSGLVPAVVWLMAAIGVGALLVYGARPVQELDADPRRIRVRHGGFRAAVVETRPASVRRVFWAGRGARCAVWAQTDAEHRLLFDGLAPDQARSLERKLEQLLGLDREDRSVLAEARRSQETRRGHSPGV